MNTKKHIITIFIQRMTRSLKKRTHFLHSAGTGLQKLGCCTILQNFLAFNCDIIKQTNNYDFSCADGHISQCIS